MKNNNCAKYKLEKKGSKTLKNGLTQTQVDAAKDLLRKVCKAHCAAAVGVKVSTVDNVLRGISPKVADLNKVLKVAQKKAKEKEEALSTLPV